MSRSHVAVTAGRVCLARTREGVESRAVKDICRAVVGVEDPGAPPG